MRREKFYPRYSDVKPVRPEDRRQAPFVPGDAVLYNKVWYEVVERRHPGLLHITPLLPWWDENDRLVAEQEVKGAVKTPAN